MNPTTQEILELARLDALGMLDSDERVVFERAFQNASPALREQIRREQNRLTDIGDLLPDVDPPQDLRARVIGAVRGAMTAVSGRNNDVLARIEPLAVTLRSNVSPLWRAACIGFATATVVLLGFAFNLQNTYDNSLQAMADGELSELISNEIGPEFLPIFLSPTAERVNFTTVADNSMRKSGATVLVDDESNMALLVCKNLPKIDGKYALVITDENGGVLKTLASFENEGQLDGQLLNGEFLPTDQLAIYASDASGGEAKPILVSL